MGLCTVTYRAPYVILSRHASVDADVCIGRRRCPQRSAQMLQGVQQSLLHQQSCRCTSYLVGALLAWLVHLRQVHPLSVCPLSASLGKAKCAVVVLAHAELAVDKAHELHGGEEAEATVRLAVDSVVEDVAQTLLAHAELRDEDIVAA